MKLLQIPSIMFFNVTQYEIANYITMFVGIHVCICIFVSLDKCCIVAAPHLYYHYIMFFIIFCLDRRVHFKLDSKYNFVIVSTLNVRWLSH